ncbi:MAG: hypothetical protein LBQ13_01620 [Endomicrobium sp.]|nr:hypothetical protein [Endomicrobium sp.]
MIIIKRSVMLMCVFCINLFFTDCLFAGKEQKFSGGQTIIVDQYVAGEIAGNGEGENGEEPFNQDPNNNDITIAEKGIDYKVYGAYCCQSTASNNSVKIDLGAIVNKSIYGGRVLGEGTIETSTVIVSGVVGESVYGGLLDRGYVGNIVVTLSSSASVGNTSTIINLTADMDTYLDAFTAERARLAEVANMLGGGRNSPLILKKRMNRPWVQLTLKVHLF